MSKLLDVIFLHGRLMQMATDTPSPLRALALVFAAAAWVAALTTLLMLPGLLIIL